MWNYFSRPPRAGALRRLWGLAFAFNLPFILFRVHRGAFDTYVHIFLADHYRQHWWSLWEPRWYMGFSVASYPPLAHQAIALLSWPLSALAAFFAPAPEAYPGAFRLWGEEAAFVLVLALMLSLFPLAVRSFARVFVGPRAAHGAALLAVCLPALSLAAWAFGQLPTLLATTLALFALARGYAYARGGRPTNLWLAAGLAGLVAAAHHGVLLFLPFAGGAVVFKAAADGLNHRRLTGTLWRLTVWIGLAGLVAAAVLWPFLQWSRGQTLQTPIDHASRHNFLADGEAAWFFFMPMYGPLLLLVPWATWQGLRRRRWLPLLAAFGALFLLGLGGTTPLPALFFGPAWEWLTYDRFSLWAGTMLLPLAGAFVATRRRAAGGRMSWSAALLMLSLAAWAVFSGWLSVISRSQPKRVDLAPIVRFLAEPEQRPYRYLTLGFGDQFAKLSTLAENGSPDGNYHTARGLPELRSSGLGALDGAVWNPRGVWALRPLLDAAPRYGLRWVFANHPAYVPVLWAAGWQPRFHVGEVMAWERRDVAPAAAFQPRGGEFAGRWWGAAPFTLLGLVVTGLALEHNARRPLTRAGLARGLAAVRRAALAAGLILLSFWWLHVFRRGDIPHVFFTYQSAMLFASDAVLAVAVGVWLVERALSRRRLNFGPKSVGYAGAALFAAAALSALVSQDRAVTLSFAAHLALLGGLYLLIVNEPPRPAWLGVVFGALLAGQSLAALVEAGQQNTYWLRGLHLPFPGLVTAAQPGASVVQYAGGQRWLRAYGTLPHPNILGGMLLVYLAGAVERFVSTGRRFWLALFALGVAALCLTFSRSAWLGAGALVVAGGLLVWRRRSDRLLPVAAASLAAAALTLLPLLPFLFARVTAPGHVAVESRSISDRARLLSAGWALIRQHPLAGVGAGMFVPALTGLPGEPVPREPVHNLPVLIAAETGLLGVLALAALCAAVLRRLWRRRLVASLTEGMWAAAVIALLVTGLFDHYWWTLPPARTLFVFTVGLWAGSSPPRNLEASGV